MEIANTMALFPFKKFLRDPLYRKSLLILFSTVGGGVLNYIFNPLVARILGPVEYGELLTVLALLNLIAIPATTSTLVTTRYTAGYFAHGQWANALQFTRGLYRAILPICLGIALVCVVLAPWLQQYLHFSSTTPLLLLVPSLVPVFFYPVALGVLQGKQQFGRISLLNTLTPLLRVGAWGIAAMFALRLNGVLFTLVLVGFAVWFLALAWSRTRVREGSTTSSSSSSPSPTRSEVLQYFFDALLANAALAFLLNIDLLAVKHFATPEVAGQYGSISLLGKAIFFFGGSLGFVLFPVTAARLSRNESSTALIYRSVISLAVIGAAAVVMFALFNVPLLGLLFGGQYGDLASTLWIAGVVFGLYSLTYILVMYFLALHYRAFLYPFLFGCVLLLILLSVWHASLQQILMVFAGTYAVLTGYLLFHVRAVRFLQEPATPVTTFPVD